MSQIYDSKIFGDGNIVKGRYKNIKIFGNGRCTGDIECEKLTVMGEFNSVGEVNANFIKVMGEADFNNNAIIGSMNVMGEADFKGRLEIESLKISGTVRAFEDLEIKDYLKIVGEMKVSKDAYVDKMKVIGQGEFKKDLKFNNINVLGELKVGGLCEGNEFLSKGSVDIEGLLSAEKVEIRPKGVSNISEIGGSEIIIKKSKINLKTLPKVITNLIEGDKIVIQNTDCKVVRGHDITILSGCSIGLIEYTGTLNVDKTSKVGEEICLKN